MSPPQLLDNKILEVISLCTLSFSSCLSIICQVNSSFLISVGGRPYDERNLYCWLGFGFGYCGGSWRDYYPLALSGLITLDDGTKYVIHGVGSGNIR